MLKSNNEFQTALVVFLTAAFILAATFFAGAAWHKINYSYVPCWGDLTDVWLEDGRQERKNGTSWWPSKTAKIQNPWCTLIDPSEPHLGYRMMTNKEIVQFEKDKE